MRYFADITFKGTNYAGWQSQKNALGVQQILEGAFTLLLKKHIAVTGAGRTDTGVHARKMVAHFDTYEKLTSDKIQWLQNKLLHLLPDDITVNKIYPVNSEAHARFSALSRTYRYYISNKCHPFLQDQYFFVKKLPDFSKMNKACEVLFKYTDFTSFSKLHSNTATNDCTIFEAGWEKQDEMYVFTIKANRFLRNMVRAIVGTLLKVGYSKIDVNDFEQIILSKNRCKAGVSVPACGLFLEDIEYPEEIFIVNDL